MAWSERIRSPLALVTLAAALLAVVVGGASGLDPRMGVVIALGVTFVVVVFVDLLLGFAVMVLFAFLESLAMLGGVSLAKLAGALLVVAWLAVLTAGGGQARNFFAERLGLTYLLLAFLGWNAISITWAEHGDATISSVTRYALNAALLPIAYTAVRDRRDAVRVLAVIVLGAAIAAVTGIASGADAAEAAYARAAGAVGDPNELAAGLLVGGTLAAAFALNPRVALPWRLAAGGASLLCLVGIVLTLSRGGLLGVIAATVLAVVMGGRWRPRIAAACAVLVLCGVGYFAAVASLPAKERVMNVGGGSGRVDLWTVGSRMVEDEPIRGVGGGQFATSSVHYLLAPGAIERGEYILLEPKVAHNTYLEVVAELGVIGGVLFGSIALFCVGCAIRAVGRFRRSGDERMEILARGFVIGLGGYLVTLLFISENYSKLMWILLGLGPVLLAVARGARDERA